MSNEEEERIRKLLGGLPKAPPMSEIEIKRFEKFIDSQVADLKKAKTKTRNNRNISIAAALILVVGGGAIFASQKNSIIQNSTPQASSNSEPSSQPSTSTSTNPTPHSTSKAKKKTSAQTDSNQQFGDGGGKVVTVGIYKTGLAYDGDLAKIAAIVTKSGTPAMLASLPEKVRNCAIKQGVEGDLLAVDQGTYQDASAYAFYTGQNLEKATILLTDESCVVLDQFNK
jgi:hypothetical protein